jgi:gamma-glutamylcyclotransferase
VGVVPWMFDGLGTSLAGLGAARVRRRVLSRAASRRVRTIVFTAGPDPYMSGFYEYLTAKIGAARHGVYLSGEGFDATPWAEEMAFQVVTAMRSALRRGVPVVRLQTRPVISDFWQEHLTALIAEFPQLFELRVFLDQTPVEVANICAIDVDDTSRNVAEMMIEMPRFLGTQRHHAATTAVFVEGHQMLARIFRDRIIELGSDPSVARHLHTREAVAGFFRGEYYFAYGSNMDAAQMLTRCPSAMMIGPAMLPEHRLVFNRSGTYRPGGVANVELSAGERVYGILWKMATGDFARLDHTEDPRTYQRERARVYSLRGQPYDCHVYLAIPDQPDLPDHDYLDSLIQAGQNAGLPPEYLTKLRARLPSPVPIPQQVPPPQATGYASSSATTPQERRRNSDELQE